jgi:hypothetical protein
MKNDHATGLKPLLPTCLEEGVPYRRAYEEIIAGRLAATRHGSRWLVSPADIRKLANGTAASSERRGGREAGAAR